MHKNPQGFLYPLAYSTNLLISFSSFLSPGYQTHLHYFLFPYLCLQQFPNTLQDTTGKHTHKKNNQKASNANTPVHRLTDHHRSGERSLEGCSRGSLLQAGEPSSCKTLIQTIEILDKNELCPFSLLM